MRVTFIEGEYCRVTSWSVWIAPSFLKPVTFEKLKLHACTREEAPDAHP